MIDFHERSYREAANTPDFAQAEEVVLAKADKLVLFVTGMVFGMLPFAALLFAGKL